VDAKVREFSSLGDLEAVPPERDRDNDCDAVARLVRVGDRVRLRVCTVKDLVGVPLADCGELKERDDDVVLVLTRLVDVDSDKDGDRLNEAVSPDRDSVWGDRVGDGFDTV